MGEVERPAGHAEQAQVPRHHQRLGGGVNGGEAEAGGELT